MITLLAYYDRISLFHTLTPFFSKKYRKNFFFTQSFDYCLKRDKNKILFMERQFLSRDPRDLTEEELDNMRKLRDKYEKIIFLNGQPEAGTNRLDLLPFVDRFFDKSVFSNYKNYEKKLYGKNLFSDYYHKKYNIVDNKEFIFKKEVTEKDAGRIELSWNIGTGVYPRPDFRQRIGSALARADFPDMGRLFQTKWKKLKDFSAQKRKIAVHSRIDPVNCASIAYQRTLFLEKIQNDSRFLTGLVPQNQYYQELANSQITLSPFGWGEVCHRDFEAVMYGSLLFKPGMSHVKTYPDIYLPDETYVPLNWDGNDLFEKAAYYLGNEKERARITRNAFEQYRAELNFLENRFAALFGEYLM